MREIIFETDNPDYRVVAQFSKNEIINYAWWLYIERKSYYKKWLLFGELKYKWVVVDQCWLSFGIESMQELEKQALSFYDVRILSVDRLIKQAIEL